MSTSGLQTQLLAVLVVDQVGSTAFLKRVGDLRADDVRGHVQAVLQEAVAAGDGRIIVGTGDGAQAVFEGVANALDAALDMLDRLERAKADEVVPDEVTLRVGVAVGDVSIADDACHGAAAVEAVTLEGAAPDGGVLCTDLTRMLAGERSEARFLHPRQVPCEALGGPISAWVVATPVVASTTGGAVGLAPTGDGPMVGRSAALRTVVDTVEAAAPGVATATFVGSEPGGGATRLLRAVVDALGADGSNTGERRLVLVARGEEGAESPPLQPILDAVADDAATDGDDDEAGRRRRLMTFLAASPDRPVLLVIDDLQWVDDATLRLLRHLLRSGSTAPVGVVGAYRSTALDIGGSLASMLDDVGRLPTVTLLPLVGLEADDVERMIDGPADPHRRRARAERLVARTAGNPFLIEHVAAHPDDTPAGDIDRIRAALGERLGRLRPSTRAVLTVAAVADRPVTADELALAGSVGDPPLQPGAVVDATDEAVAAGLLEELVDDDVRYRFRHDVLRAALVDGMTASRRALVADRLAADNDGRGPAW
ncbi:MAG: AAA family ATPase [Actinomycetota bacterium]